MLNSTHTSGVYTSPNTVFPTDLTSVLLLNVPECAKLPGTRGSYTLYAAGVQVPLGANLRQTTLDVVAHARGECVYRDEFRKIML